MSNRGLNKVFLLGNLTADPELRYTPQGTAVATFTIATNRSWTDQAGQLQEGVEFTRCVAWAKRAEICSQILYKGRKAFVEGRLQTREWEGQDKVKRRTTEVVVDNMIALGPAGSSPRDATVAPSATPEEAEEVLTDTSTSSGENDQKVESVSPQKSGDQPVPSEDIPF